MSERMTDIAPRGGGPGLMECGRRTHAEMVTAYRSFYRRQLAEAEAALAVADADLRVTTGLGPVVMRNRTEVLPEVVET